MSGFACAHSASPQSPGTLPQHRNENYEKHNTRFKVHKAQKVMRAYARGLALLLAQPDCVSWRNLWARMCLSMHTHGKTPSAVAPKASTIQWSKLYSATDISFLETELPNPLQKACPCTLSSYFDCPNVSYGREIMFVWCLFTSTTCQMILICTSHQIILNPNDCYSMLFTLMHENVCCISDIPCYSVGKTV